MSEVTIPDVPISRVEQYLNNIATGSGALPPYPISRKEQYLAKIAENGGGGGSATWGSITGTLSNQTDLSELLDTKANKMLTASSLPATAVVNTIYSLGQQSAITTALPAGTTVGDIISIIWYNGSTAATVTINGTMIPFSYTPAANSRSEINAMWDGTNWCLVSNEQAVTASE